MKRFIVGLSAAIALAACATPPAVVPFENSRNVMLSKDEVWANLVEYFATSNISIKTIEKDSGIIYAERMFTNGNDISTVASCGSGFLSVAVGATADLNVFVRPQGDSTRVTVTTNFRQARSSALSPSVVDAAGCNSLGVLEGAILEAAAGR